MNRRVKGEMTRSMTIVDMICGLCPECGTIGRREGFGRVACHECGLIYALVEEVEE